MNVDLVRRVERLAWVLLIHFVEQSCGKSMTIIKLFFRVHWLCEMKKAPCCSWWRERLAKEYRAFCSCKPGRIVHLSARCRKTMEQILEGFRIDLTPDPFPALSHRSNITRCKHWKHNLVRRRCAFFVCGWICWVQFHAMMPDLVLTALLSVILFLGIGLMICLPNANRTTGNLVGRVNSEDCITFRS